MILTILFKIFGIRFVSLESPLKSFQPILTLVQVKFITFRKLFDLSKFLASILNASISIFNDMFSSYAIVRAVLNIFLSTESITTATLGLFRSLIPVFVSRVTSAVTLFAG